MRTIDILDETDGIDDDVFDYAGSATQGNSISGA
mgnify:CR=1 FL=1